MDVGLNKMDVGLNKMDVGLNKWSWVSLVLFL